MYPMASPTNERSVSQKKKWRGSFQAFRKIVFSFSFIEFMPSGFHCAIRSGLRLECFGRSATGVSREPIGVQSLSVSSITHVLNNTAANTGGVHSAQYGSVVATSVSLSPLSIPKDIYYVLVRPLPFQAHGLTQLASSLENSFLVALFVVSWRRVGSALKAIRRHPYLLVAALYSLVWIVLFASIGNLGILVRERTSLLPLLLVLVCWPARAPMSEIAAGTPNLDHSARSLPLSGSGTS